MDDKINKMLEVFTKDLDLLKKQRDGSYELYRSSLGNNRMYFRARVDGYDLQIKHMEDYIKLLKEE